MIAQSRNSDILTTETGTTRTLVDVFDRFEQTPDDPFLTYVDIDGKDHEPVAGATFGELAETADRFAAALHRHGVRRGDRVAVVALPRPEYVAVLLGAMRLGAVPAPINHQFKVRELGATLAILEARVVVVDETTVVVAEQAVAGLSEQPTLAGISGFDGVDLVLTTAPASDYPRPEIGPEDPALILHSSGTTGLPKTVLRTHGSVTEFLALFATYFDDDERLLNFLPLYHQAGLILNVFTAAYLRVELVQASRFTASSFWSLIDRYGATHSNLVSPMASFVLAQPRSEHDRRHSLRWVVVAGRNDHWADFQDRFGVVGMTFYGSTESLQITSSGNPQRGPVPRSTLEAVGSSNYTGFPIDSASGFRIVGSDGTTVVDLGTTGQLEVRSHFCFTEYFNQPALTRDAFTEDGWFKTGDLAYSRADGSLVLVGRESGMIRRSGENIAPREIELLLEDHPSIDEALVVAVPDDARGQEILAQVVAAEDAALTADAVFAYLADNLSAFKVPRYLRFCTQFERTSTLKIKLDQGAIDANRTSWHERTAP